MIAFNKWDLVDEERRYYLEREIERELVQVQWAPRINVTARTGWHIDRLVPALEKALEGWETRITTGQLNAFLGRAGRRAPAPGPRRQAAPDPVRHPGRHRAADVRAVHHRQAGRRLRALHRAPPARGVRLRRHPDRDLGAAAREAQAVVACGASSRGHSWSGWSVSSRPPSGATVSRDPVSRAVAPRPASGTTCRVFPANNWWHADVSRPAGRTPAAAPGCRACRPSGTCTPTSGRRTATGRTTASRSRSSAARTGRCRCASTTRSESDRVRYPSARTPGSRAAAAPRATSTRSWSTGPTAGSTRPGYTRVARRPLAGRLRGHLEAVQQPAPARRLDLRRRRRPADPAGPAAVERGQGGQGRPRDPVHHRRHRGDHLWPARHDAGSEPGARLPADGRALPAAGVVRRDRATARHARVVVRAMKKLRPGAGRQRLPVVLPGRAQRALAGPADRATSSGSRPPRSSPSTPEACASAATARPSAPADPGSRFRCGSPGIPAVGFPPPRRLGGHSGCGAAW